MPCVTAVELNWELMYTAALKRLLTTGPLAAEAVWHPIQMTHSFISSPLRPVGSRSLERHIHRSGTSLERDNV